MMTSIFNKDAIRENTIEASDLKGELTKAQKLADFIKAYAATPISAGWIRERYQDMHGPLPAPGANERERNELPPVGTVVVRGDGAIGLVWAPVAGENDCYCAYRYGPMFCVSPGNWRFATDAEIDAFLQELPE